MAKSKNKKKKQPKEKSTKSKEKKLSMDDATTKAIVDSCADDGQTLCERYLVAVIRDESVSRNDASIADTAARIWESMVEDDQKSLAEDENAAMLTATWKNSTYQLKRQNMPEARARLDVDGTSGTSQRLRVEAAKQFDNYRRKEAEATKLPLSIAGQPASRSLTPTTRDGAVPQEGSEWRYYKEILDAFRPLSKDKRESLAKAIVNKARARCAKNISPDYTLLKKPPDLATITKTLDTEAAALWKLRHEEWTLWQPNEGLGAKIMAAMDGDGLFAEALEDRVEKVLSDFAKVVSEKMYGGRKSEG